MKTLLTEIHRRSLWQVVVIYLVGASVVFWVVGALTESVGLPAWTPGMAFILLLIALPFTVAAAFVRDPGDDTNAVAGLVAELHRRSLWQVMGIFLAGSWGALQVVEVMTETAALPDWTPTMAFVLLLVGLPICLATAFVQEGLPGGGEGGDEEVAGSASQGATRLLTWRNALMGAVGAFVLLGVSAGGYLAMWTMGIGPFGNLVAQGIITEGQQVILADFDDTTGEGLGAVVTEALRVDLLEASMFSLLEDADLAPTLAQMELTASEPLHAERALEAAQRAGIPAVIDGDVASAGSGYIITTTLREAESGRSFASLRVTAAGPDDVIASIDKLSQDLRERSGESLRNIRAGKPLEQVTTGSLEALKLYTEAERARNDGDVPGSVELLERALARDSTFAMAWRLLFVTSRDTTAASKAFQLRERLPDLERYVVEGLYYSVIAGDRTRSAAAYERALDIDPSELRALNNLAGHLVFRGDLERAKDLYIRAVEGGGAITLPRLLLRRTLIDLGEFEEATARSQLRDVTPDSDFRGFVFDLAFARGDLSTAANFVGDRSGGPEQILNIGDATNQARLALWTGRLDEARGLNLRAEELGAPGGWNPRTSTALTEVLVGDPLWGRRHITEAQFEDRPPPYASLALAFSGDAEAAQLLLDHWTTALSPAEKAKPNVARELDLWALFVRVARGDTVGAVGAFQRLTIAEECVDSCWPSLEARLHDTLGLHERAIELHERMLRPGYAGWGRDRIHERLYSMLRLGPLYEEAGDTAEAIVAYQRVVEQWANADARGQEIVSRFRARIAALGG